MIITDLRPDAFRFFKVLHRHEINRIGTDITRHGLFIGTNYYFIRLRSDLKDKYRISERKSEPFSLSYCIMDDSFMSAYNSSITCHEIARLHLLSGILFYIRSIISIRNKTDILTVWFVRHLKCDFRCKLTDLVFRIFPDWHKCSRKLFLRQIIECISLVFCSGCGCMKRIASVWKLFDLRIVTGRDIICSDIQASLQERFPFYISITGNTRIRCPSIFIFIYKIINDMFFEFFLKIHNIIRDTDCCCYASGIVYGA